MSGQQVLLVFIALAALTVASASLLAPGPIGRLLAGIGLLTAPMMDVRPASWLTLSDVFLVASLPPLLMATRRRHAVAFVRGPSRWLLAIAALVVIGGTVGALTSAGDPGFDIALKFLASVGVVSMVIWCVVVDKAAWQGAATLFVVGASVSAMVAIANPGAYGQGRSLGLTNHPNHLGFSMLLAIGIAGGLAGSKNLSQRIVAIASAPLLLWALLSSGSRAALLGLAVTIFVTVALSRGARTPALTAGALAAIGLALALPGKIESGPSALSRTLSPSDLEANSSAERAANLQAAIDRILERPLIGHGFADALTYHSVPLQLVVVAGIFGVLAIGVAIFAVSRMVARTSRPGISLMGRSSAAGVAGALCALVVSNQFFDRYALAGLVLMSTGVWLSTSDRTAGPTIAVVRRTRTPHPRCTEAINARQPGRELSPGRSRPLSGDL